MKRLLLIGLSFAVMLLALSCKGESQKTSELNSITDAAKKGLTVTPKVEGDQEINDHISIVYDIKEDRYEKAGISIKYPKLAGLKDAKKQDKINQLIKKDALRNVEDYMIEGAVLEVGYEISWKGENLLSIMFVVYSNYPGAAHPNHSFYSTNVAIDTASRVMLKDTVELSEDFITDFITGSVYTAPFEDVNQELSDLVDSEINSLTPEGLKMADDAGVYTPYYSYYTEHSLGIAIEVPFAVGGYALYEVPYKDISKHINQSNQIWKDIPELLTQSGESGKVDIDNRDEDVVKEGDYFLPIVVEELVLGGYDGKDWVDYIRVLGQGMGV